MRVLVAGATGYLGRYVVRELAARGHEVRALARTPDKLAPVRDAVAEVHVADATDPEALRGCCDGVDAVFSSVGLVGKSGGLTCWQVDHAGNRNLLAEAVRAGAGNFVYTSVVHSPGLEKVQLVRAKRAFEAELQRSGMPYTILRPNGFFSDMDDFLRMARKGRAYVFGRGTLRINPVHGADVAVAAADAVASTGRDGGTSTTVALGGPDVLTHEQVAREAFAALGTKPRVTSLPLWPLRTALVLMRRLTPLRTHQLIEFPLTVLTQDVLAPTTGERHLADHFRESAAAS